MPNLRKGVNLLIEDLLQQILEEQKKTNTLLENLAIVNTEDPRMSDLLTPKQISEQYEINRDIVYRIFKYSNLEVQRYTKPFRIKRKCWEKFLESSHAELCK